MYIAMSIGRAYTNYYSQLAREEAQRKGIEWPPKDKYDILVDLLIIGDRDVGKAHFSARFCYDHFGSRFPDTPSTVSVADDEVRKVFVDEKLIKIQIRDTHGIEFYPSLISLRHGKGIIIVYDITNQDSFESVQGWLDELKAERYKDSVKFLVGNKADLSKDLRQVPTDAAIEFAHQHDMLFFETSCKDGTNVELAIMTMVAKILEGTTTKRKHKLKSEDSRSCCIA